MKKHLLLILSGFLFLTGCRLDEPVIPKELLNSPGLSNTYFPSEKNTTWVYQSFLFGQLAGESTQTVTGLTQTSNGKLFYEVKSFDGTETGLGYYSKANGLYTIKGETMINSLEEEFEYLKENASVGETWTTNFTANEQGQNERAVYTLKEKNATKVVLGRTYTSVIRTFVDLQTDEGDGFTSKATLDFYVAKGIGIIQIDMNILGLEVSTQLKSYTIK